MEFKDIKSVYFVGAGGIGMSAIARYFIRKGVVVAGYDKTPSTLTHQLEREGMLIHYEENVNEIPHACRDTRNCSSSATEDSRLRSEPRCSVRSHSHTTDYA